MLQTDGRPHLTVFHEANVIGQLRGNQASLDRQVEPWANYEAFNGHLPSEAELQHLRALVIPGSTSAAYDDLPWIASLSEFIRHIYNDYPAIKLVGICFGSQIIAVALGGLARKMPIY